MSRIMLKSKIHRAVVTHSELDYEGSIEVDSELLKAADIVCFEQVQVWNITNGERFTTYAMEAEPGSGRVCINGAASHKAVPGDLVIISSFVNVEEEDLYRFEPKIVFVDEKNRLASIKRGFEKAHKIRQAQ